MSWAWRSLPRTTALERLVEVLNQAMLGLQNTLGREPVRRNGRVVAAAQVLLGTDGLVIVDTTAGNLTVTLPDARANVGRVLAIKKRVAGNTLTVDTLGSDEVEGGSSEAWTTAGEVRSYQSVLDVDVGTTDWFRVA